jgi:fucose permease
MIVACLLREAVESGVELRAAMLARVSEVRIKMSQHLARSSPLLLLMIAYLAFISLGLPDTLIGVAWPSVRDHFDLPQSAIAFIFFGTGCSYFFSSFFTGRLVNVLGIGVLLAASSALVALSGFGFGLAPLWAVFATSSLLHGLGSGAIDGGLNHYAAHHFSAKHMNWLHACYAVGATLGPLIMTGVITWHGSWRMGYLSVAVILLSLALLFASTRRKWAAPKRVHPEGEQEPSAAAGMMVTLRQPVVWLQVLLFFVYTGLEVTVGQWSFTVLTESRGIPKETAGLWVTMFWGSLAAGRILFGFVVERVGIDLLIRSSMLLSLTGAILFALDVSAAASAMSLAILGLGLAAIFPCMMTQTPKRLGKSMAGHAIGFQVSAAMLGAAALPSLSGILAEWWGLRTIGIASVAMAAGLFLLHEALLLGDRRRL